MNTAHKEKGNVNTSDKFLILEYLSHTILEGQLVLSTAFKPEWYLRAAGPRLLPLNLWSGGVWLTQGKMLTLDRLPILGGAEMGLTGERPSPFKVEKLEPQGKTKGSRAGESRHPRSASNLQRTHGAPAWPHILTAEVSLSVR